MPFGARISAWILGISVEELERQHVLLTTGYGLRVILTALTYALAALMIPLHYVLVCAAVDFTSERIGLKWLHNLTPAKTPWRYLGTLGAVVVSQLAFTIMLAISYQQNTPLAQGFATGVLTLTLLQMASVRVVHKPYAAVGLATSFLVAVVAIAHDWPSRSGPGGLVFSYIALASAGYFIYAIVNANHALHDGFARERVAAKVADQAKSRFLAQMSHELRTPLNAILGLSHAELAQASDPASQERMRLVTESARGLAVMLDDILDMAAVEAGHLPIRPVACDLAAELTAATAVYRPLFEAKSLYLTLTLSPDLPAYARVDTQRLRQCLSNLFSNALKHTTSGGVQIKAEAPTPILLAITICDTGPGVPALLADRLFEPFQRGSTEHPGSGLGLSISRSLARAMGGDLQFAPPALPDQTGACFRLTLRLAHCDAPKSLEVPPRAAPSNLRLPQFTPLNSPTVLVVDDIATNRLVAKAHLALHGVTVVEAASGAQALEIVRTSPPDLVLLDMNMPNMDGTTTQKRICQMRQGLPQIPIIAMTADTTDDHKRQYLAAGMDGYLAKPLTPEAVAAILARYLGAPS